MLRPVFIATALAVLACCSPSVPPSSSQRQPSDLPAQFKTLGEEVGRLKLKVAELEKDVDAIRNHLGCVTLSFDGDSQHMLLPKTIELPPGTLPPARDPLPWNYDSGLYVFPGQQNVTPAQSR